MYGSTWTTPEYCKTTVTDLTWVSSVVDDTVVTTVLGLVGSPDRICAAVLLQTTGSDCVTLVQAATVALMTSVDLFKVTLP